MHQPLRKNARRSTAIFKADRAEFRRVDADIETVVDIVVSPEDDAEVRRVTLFNSSSRTRTLEVTSFVQKGSPSLLLLDHDYFGRAANYRGGGTST